MLDQTLPDAVKAGRLFTEVRQGDALLFRYTSLFEVGSGLDLLQPAPPTDPNRFQFQARYNPVRSLLSVKGDTYSLEDPGQARALYYRILPENGGDPIAEGVITQTAEYFLQDLIELAPPPPGAYIVEGTMALQDGTRLGPMTGRFEKKDEAEPA